MTAGYLVDTSVLSNIAPGRQQDHRLAEWLRSHADQIYFSAITVAEIEQGICKLSRTGNERQAQSLSVWLDGLVTAGAEKFLPFDVPANRHAGKLSDRLMAEGRHPGFADVAIAATAFCRDLIVLTYNSRHFIHLGVGVIDPSEGLPA